MALYWEVQCRDPPIHTHTHTHTHPTLAAALLKHRPQLTETKQMSIDERLAIMKERKASESSAGVAENSELMAVFKKRKQSQGTGGCGSHVTLT